MKNTLKINHTNRIIIMDRTFSKNAENTQSTEYAHLQTVRRDYPDYTVIKRSIKTNKNQNHYKGLTYEFIEDYILTHGSADDINKNWAEYQEKRLISECHSKAFRYPVIKAWFLDLYPGILSYGYKNNETITIIEEKEANN